MIKVCVIIPVFNMEKYIKECLNSIINQSIFDEIQVICINDGSTDKSSNIIKEYAAFYTNVMLVNQTNRGSGYSRNKGIELSEGEFIAFMDPDDFYPDDNVLEYLYEKAKKNKVLICGGALNKLKNGIMLDSEKTSNEYLYFTEEKKINYKDYQGCLGFQRFIYNADMLKKNNIYFPHYSRGQDAPFFVNAMLTAKVFYAVRENTYCYRTEYRKINYSRNQIIDLLKTHYDLLKISKCNNFDILHMYSLEILNNSLYPDICKYIKDEAVMKEIDRIYEIINYDLLNKKNKNYLKSNLLLSNIINDMSQLQKRQDSINTEIKNYTNIIIYGAGSIGKLVYEYIKEYLDKKCICFAVTTMEGNANELCGIPVVEIGNLKKYSNDSLILVATCVEKYRESIFEILEEYDFKNKLWLNYKEIELYKMFI